MNHHIYAVWDFMCLLKCLQQHIAPAAVPWNHNGNPILRRFINDLVLAEESDEGLPGAQGEPTYTSHFSLYWQSMGEVGADVETPLRFVEEVYQRGIHSGLGAAYVPPAARRFMTFTFHCIESQKPHLVAAALALGREQIIPEMFSNLLGELGVPEGDCPAFRYYLKRHIHLDQDAHGPMSSVLLHELCAGNPGKVREAAAAAQLALEARLQFWDEVLAAMHGARP
jgi:hypothetical protein